jgi:hypothetical protein
MSIPWESREALVARCLAAYPTVHPVVDRFRDVGVSRPVGLTDPNDVAFMLGALDSWATTEEELSPGISELRDALRYDATRK